MTDKIPSGTSASPSSAVSPKAEMVLCLSLRLSELRRGADVFRFLRDFLNMVLVKLSQHTNSLRFYGPLYLNGKFSGQGTVMYQKATLQHVTIIFSD